MLESAAMIEMEAGDAFVTVAPTDGGRIAQIQVGELALLKDDRSGGPMTWGSYPMAPWAGRVRHGRFEFDGRTHQLPRNLEPHAIHGTVFTADWEVVDAGRDYCELRTPLTWAFGGTAHQHLALDEHGLTCILSVYAVQQAMPAVIGWHPCFRKPLMADLEFEAMHVRDHEYIATAELVAPKPHPWDDCFVRPVTPLRLHHPGLTLTIDSDCGTWVVYDEPDDITCVEPQSAPPDAFTIGGAVRLEPGELLQRRMTLRWGR
jgi:aldose 1-epimerase